MKAAVFVEPGKVKEVEKPQIDGEIKLLFL